MKLNKKLSMFPWYEEVYLQSQGSFTFGREKAVEGILESLVKSVKAEMTDIFNDNNVDRGEALLNVVKDCLFYFHVQNILLKEGFQDGKCLYLKLLSNCIDLCIFLSAHLVSSHMNLACQHLFLCSKSNVAIMFDVLLNCCLLKKSYAEICCPILRHVLSSSINRDMEPEQFIKFILLSRLWKVFTPDTTEKEHVKALVARVKVPGDFMDFISLFPIPEISSIPSSVSKKKIPVYLLCNKFSKNVLMEVKQVLCSENWKSVDKMTTSIQVGLSSGVDEYKSLFHIDTGSVPENEFSEEYDPVSEDNNANEHQHVLNFDSSSKSPNDVFGNFVEQNDDDVPDNNVSQKEDAVKFSVVEVEGKGCKQKEASFTSSPTKKQLAVVTPNSRSPSVELPEVSFLSNNCSSSKKHKKSEKMLCNKTIKSADNITASTQVKTSSEVDDLDTITSVNSSKEYLSSTDCTEQNNPVQEQNICKEAQKLQTDFDNTFADFSKRDDANVLLSKERKCTDINDSKVNLFSPNKVGRKISDSSEKNQGLKTTKNQSPRGQKRKSKRLTIDDDSFFNVSDVSQNDKSVGDLMNVSSISTNTGSLSSKQQSKEVAARCETWIQEFETATDSESGGKVYDENRLSKNDFQNEQDSEPKLTISPTLSPSKSAEKKITPVPKISPRKLRCRDTLKSSAFKDKAHVKSDVSSVESVSDKDQCRYVKCLYPGQNLPSSKMNIRSRNKSPNKKKFLEESVSKLMKAKTVCASSPARELRSAISKQIEVLNSPQTKSLRQTLMKDFTSKTIKSPRKSPTPIKITQSNESDSEFHSPETSECETSEFDSPSSMLGKRKKRCHSQSKYSLRRQLYEDLPKRNVIKKKSKKENAFEVNESFVLLEDLHETAKKRETTTIKRNADTQDSPKKEPVSKNNSSYPAKKIQSDREFSPPTLRSPVKKYNLRMRTTGNQGGN